MAKVRDRRISESRERLANLHSWPVDLPSLDVVEVRRLKDVTMLTSSML